MIQKKIFTIGAFAVGKTSLVKRFVKSIFDERYLTTVGVKVDKKVVRVDHEDVTLMLWDLEGQDQYHNVRSSYFKGASGYMVVVDGTNKVTLEVAMQLNALVLEKIGKVPYLVLLNKIDLTDSWEITEEDELELTRTGATVLKTSAKTGQGVEEAFLVLAGLMVKGDTP